MDQTLNDTIFEQLKMGDLTQEEKVNFSKNFFIALNTRVNARLVAQMSPAQQDHLIELTTSGDETKIAAYKREQFPNIEDIVSQESAKLITDITSGAQSITDEQVERAEAQTATNPQGV